jgi:hypothetical protein
MRDRAKILNNLHDLYMQRDHADDMAEMYYDRADLLPAAAWEKAADEIDRQIAKQRQALTKAGSYGTFANPANNYMEVWA